jgi:hypothetical protein
VPDDHVLFVEQDDQFLVLNVGAADKRPDVRDEVLSLRRRPRPSIDPNVRLSIGEGRRTGWPVYAFDVAAGRLAVDDQLVDGAVSCVLRTSFPLLAHPVVAAAAMNRPAAMRLAFALILPYPRLCFLPCNHHSV